MATPAASMALSTNLRGRLQHQFTATRLLSEQLVDSLSEADVQLQSMPDASPSKWHLAHTTWFFETFILVDHVSGYQRVNEEYNYLFNSYYNGIGKQYHRAHRGLISRPSLAEVMIYRHRVNQAIHALLDHCSEDTLQEIDPLLVLGVNHEQQHQELLLTDIKHALSFNPLFPVYRVSKAPSVPVEPTIPKLSRIQFDEGVYNVGNNATVGGGFCFDNESPQHSVYIHTFEMANRLITNGEYIEFINAGAYQKPEYWLADGWAWVQQEQVNAPLYWSQDQQQWMNFTLSGLQAVDVNTPVTHVNYYEAAAYAQWAGARLPTEFEWEVAAQSQSAHRVNTAALQLFEEPHLLDEQHYHPSMAAETKTSSLLQMTGEVWQWTSSSYSAYPGFTPFAGNAGEYNGKFMSSQYVLRGSSCVTSPEHTRTTYRNFFYAHQAWQFTGIRLAYS